MSMCFTLREKDKSRHCVSQPERVSTEALRSPHSHQDNVALAACDTCEGRGTQARRIRDALVGEECTNQASSTVNPESSQEGSNDKKTLPAKALCGPRVIILYLVYLEDKLAF